MKKQKTYNKFQKYFLAGKVTILLLFVKVCVAQNVISGKIYTDSIALSKVHIILTNTRYKTYSDENGNYKFNKIPDGEYTIKVTAVGYISQSSTFQISGKQTKQIDFHLKIEIKQLEEVSITGKKINEPAPTRLNDVEGTAIYAGKKTELVVMKDVNANLATNNTRQIYSKIAGLNIWESDGAGLQLGIGGRGLNPSRTSNFNTRQNGYDISADALGYPESYYSPPAEAIERIEIVRGAASLQYGTQFGGFINFKLKQAPDDKPFQITSRLTYGSWQMLNSFTSIGGTKGKISYYTFYQHKQGNGWRPNSGFNVNTAFGSIGWQVSEKLKITGEYTFMNYLAQQPGGLTDAQFEKDPSQSIRKRNWFKVNWNLVALNIDYKINSHIRFNSRTFALMAQRSALGILSTINRADPLANRDLWTDAFENIGNENRLIYTYKTGKQLSAFLIGTRIYRGHTSRKQGLANSAYTGTKNDFSFVNPEQLEYSEYLFPSYNTAIFAENIFRLSSKLTLTPGIRYEYISTNAKGYYNTVNRDLAQNIILSQRTEESRTNNRDFVLAGAGLAYTLNSSAELYSNFSQNYRSINFNDMRVANPNFRVDPNLKDEKGYTTDAGIRGNWKGIVNYDVSIFLLKYNNRIGSVILVDKLLYTTYRYRTNISDSRNAGIETFAEVDIWKLIAPKAKPQLTVFANVSYIDAMYINTREAAYQNKKVELVPNIIAKSGINFKHKGFGAAFQYSYTGEQFTDATNSTFTANAVGGIVPAYYVMDLSLSYEYKYWGIFTGINNLSDNRYFTRRAEGYPGPGIIPSDARSYYVTVQFKW